MSSKLKSIRQYSKLHSSMLLSLALFAFGNVCNKSLAADAGKPALDAPTPQTAGALLEVTVVATNDLKPLAGAKVFAGQPDLHTNLMAYTDANGVARFHLHSGSNRISASKRDWFPQHAMAEVQGGVTNRLTIELTPAPRITGIVRDSSGVPATNVLVSFHPGQFPGASDYSEVRTDANGRYDLILQVNPRGFWWGYSNPINFVLARDFRRNLAAIHEFTAIPTNLDLDLQPGITISGSVKDTNGAPITPASVDLSILSGGFVIPLEPQPIEVDSQGKFSIPALPQGRDYGMYQGVAAPNYVPGSGWLKAENSKTNHYEFPPFVLVQRHVNQIKL
jgi:hypothetical protein